VKNAALFVLMILISSQLSAYSLAVKVTVSQDTLAVGTNVSLVHEGVEVANAKTSVNGTAIFDVAGGSYFIQLRRYPYPLHVSLIQVEKDTAITLTMRELVSYANAYGQVSGPTDFANSTVTAYSGGQVAKRITSEKNGYPDKNGYYILSFIPEGNYKMEFTVPGFEQKAVDVFLPSSDFVEVNAKLAKIEPKPEPKVSLSSLPSVVQHSIISLRLMNGDEPLSGHNVTVQTPSGDVILTTSADGTLSINAAEAGKYVFTYGNLASTTEVLAKESKPVPPAAEQPPAVQPEQPPANVPATNASADTGGLTAGAFIFFVLLFIVIIAAAAAWYMLSSMSKGGKKGGEHAKGHEHHHSHEHKAHHKK